MLIFLIFLTFLSRRAQLPVWRWCCEMAEMAEMEEMVKMKGRAGARAERQMLTSQVQVHDVLPDEHELMNREKRMYSVSAMRVADRTSGPILW